MLAGPLLPSPSFTSDNVDNRARHRVPPPSTPSNKISDATNRIPAGSKLQTHQNEFGSLGVVFESSTKPAIGRQMSTERSSPRYSDIDVWEPSEILDTLIEGQFAAVAAVRAQRPAIEAAALAIEAGLRQGGRLVYAGAGTSGRLAVQDGAELIPTFSWPSERLILLMAGGPEALLKSIEGAEDESEQGIRLVHEHKLTAADVLVAVAASGRTPFTLACLREGKRQGALTIGIANNIATPILNEADHPIW